MPEPTAASGSQTIHMEGDEQVYPCRCGETHRGPYAVYDFGHHNCFHDEPLQQLMTDDPDWLICPMCGKTFRVERSLAVDP